jgi:hypothetical protein
MKAAQQSLKAPRPAAATSAAGLPFVRVLPSVFNEPCSSSFFCGSSVACAAGRGALRLLSPQLWSRVHRSKGRIRYTSRLLDVQDADPFRKARRRHQCNRMQVGRRFGNVWS